MNTQAMNAELRLRHEKVRQVMATCQIEACLIASNVNLIYLSGQVFSGYIYIEEEGDPLYFVKRPIGMEGDHIVYVRKPEEIPDRLRERGRPLPSRLALEQDQLSYTELIRLQAAMLNPSIANATAVLRSARLTKTPLEIEWLRQSGRTHCQCMRQVPSLFREGMSDIAFSIEIERLFRLHGSLGAIRIFGSSMELHMGSVLAGDNAQTPSPYDFAMGGAGLHPTLPIAGNGTIIQPGMAVMVDVGGSFTPNMTDMTRVYSFGKLPETALAAHQVCLEIEADIAAVAKPGTPCADLYHMACQKAARYGFADHFMGTLQQAPFIGHGIGLELNEPPVLAPRSPELLIEGMTFALEPKIVIPHVGALGVENSYLVTSHGIENITPLPSEIVEL